MRYINIPIKNIESSSKLTYYHITSSDNVKSILKNGLIPYSKKSKYTEERIYVGTSIGRLIDLWDQMREENYHSDSYAVLQVRLNPNDLKEDLDMDYDGFYITKPVNPIDIKLMFYE